VPSASTSEPALTGSPNASTGPRTLEVPATRLPRWAAGFAERHGPVSCSPSGRPSHTLLLVAGDGTIAGLSHPWGTPDPAGPGDPGRAVTAFASGVIAPRRVAAVLVRRGGYACALIDTAGAGRVVASKVGTRYVQSRTAAGGWSQQRFARRREKQTDELAGAAAEVAARLLLDPPATDLATGGDRALVDRVLADSRLRPLAMLPRGPHLRIGDPKADVVRALPDLLTRVTVTLTAGSPV
jgi:Actinobacteria/chloroflexi VLRF1 release factor